jgi:hypothetical protein
LKYSADPYDESSGTGGFLNYYSSVVAGCPLDEMKPAMKYLKG